MQWICRNTEMKENEHESFPERRGDGTGRDGTGEIRLGEKGMERWD